MRLLIAQSLSSSYYLVHFRPKHILQHSTLRHAQPVFLSQCDGKVLKFHCPYPTTDKITALRIFLYSVFSSKLEHKTYWTGRW
jgi:hypothetical protein